MGYGGRNSSLRFDVPNNKLKRICCTAALFGGRFIITANLIPLTEGGGAVEK